MKRIAAPMVGEIFASFILELLVYPAIYAVWRQGSLKHEFAPEEDFRTGYDEVETGHSELLTLRLQQSSD